MIFKSSSVALMVSTAITCGANASEAPKPNSLGSSGSTQPTQINLTDTKATFVVAVDKNGVYIVNLIEKAALDKSYNSLGDDRSSVVQKINTQQIELIKQIKSLDSSAVVLHRTRLIDNSIHIQLSHDAATLLKNNSLVANVTLTNEDANNTAENAYQPYPNLTVKEHGDDITVAIIGNGVDYTHAALGGNGKAEDYAKAWDNRSNAWDGFPTDTVISGLDFSANSEGYHSVDYNPLENVDDVNVANGFYPSGTAQASMVLEQAPNAKILAYKTYDWASAFFYPALDFIVDPNQDGDISDRPDIIVVNSYGTSGHYEEKGSGRSSVTARVDHLRRLSGMGSLVVTSAGTNFFSSMFNLGNIGVTPEALTVGSVSVDNNIATLSEFTPAGPVRGDQLLKPEVVAPAQNLIGPIVGTGNVEALLGNSGAYAAAHAAGVAARVWAAQPNLSAYEVKALVANTASSENVQGQTVEVDVFGLKTNITTVAEVPFMGTGLVNVDNATTAKAVVWETSSLQPGLAFGFVETATSSAQTRNLTIKNLTSELQEYAVTSQVLGVKESNSAIGFIHPQSIMIPANHAVTFSVTMTIDAENLGTWPIVNTDDYTMENWMKATINGYLTFTNVANGGASLKTPWQVFPKVATNLVKSNSDFGIGLPYPAPQWSEKLSLSGSWVESSSIDVENNSAVDKTLFAMPLMQSLHSKTPAKATVQGNIIKDTGASIYPEASCASEQALAVSVSMFDSFDIPMAEHFDKAGIPLTWFKIYNKELTDSYADDPKGLEDAAQDNQTLALVTVLYNDDGQPVTRFLDLNLAFDPSDPTARFRYSKLPTLVAPGGTTVVSRICLDDLYHDDIQSIDAWNESLGWQFATDRDARSAITEDVIRFNPVISGYFNQEIIDHTGEDGYPNWWDTNCQPQSWKPDNCIEASTDFHASTARVTLLPAEGDIDEDALSWSSFVTIPAGRSARVSAGLSSDCDPNKAAAGGEINLADTCPPGVAFFDLETSKKQYFGIAASLENDKTAVTGQSYSVYENVENGTVIGTIARQSLSFFSNDDYAAGDAFLLNQLPGTPFAVATSGEISVINADAIDYETHTSYLLKIQIDHVNRAGEPVDVVVNVTNSNDVAPIQISSINTIESQVGSAILVSIANSFNDIEGDGISFIGDNLPDGLAISLSGVISGAATNAGDFTATIKATDGVNTTTVNVDFAISDSPESIAPAPEQPSEETSAEPASSGAGFGFFFMILAALGFASRRVSK